MVHEQEQFISKGTNNISVDVSHLLSGLYHIVLQGAEFRIVDRLVIEN
jgi:hypothetical protein